MLWNNGILFINGACKFIYKMTYAKDAPKHTQSYHMVIWLYDCFILINLFYCLYCTITVTQVEKRLTKRLEHILYVLDNER